MATSRSNARLRAGGTLVLLLGLMVGGVSWGWAQMTKPFPGKVDPPICVDTEYQAGDELYVQDITVSVLNASTREGLAGRTLSELEDAGFARGQTGNAPAGTSLKGPAEIWVRQAGDPAGALLRRWIGGKVSVVERPDNPAAGVTLVVGNRFGEVQEGPASLTVEQPAMVCGPPVQ